ncbi:hypothetical protein O6H91_Y415300 [Diphasiastrum complanatum]|nr:hypothetical protein O6H91_Y415300 [Diphasiastrum complanatum]
MSRRTPRQIRRVVIERESDSEETSDDEEVDTDNEQEQEQEVEQPQETEAGDEKNEGAKSKRKSITISLKAAKICKVRFKKLWCHFILISCTFNLSLAVLDFTSAGVALVQHKLRGAQTIAHILQSWLARLDKFGSEKFPFSTLVQLSSLHSA